MQGRGARMTDYLCGAVLIAMNEEKRIQETLESLRNQTVRIFLVVVNDGSTDRTGAVASEYADVVVNLPAHKENWTGRPELTRVFNAGFDVLKKESVAYILISGADDVYPPRYVEDLINRMRKERVVLASGLAEGESSRSLAPRGGGRIVEAEWFRTIRFKYPEIYGFEVYPVYKALSQNKKVTIYSDMSFKLSRGTRLSRRKMHLWGKGMKALHYWSLYAIGRSVLIAMKRPLNGLEMLRGYLSGAPKCCDDLREFVPEFQKRMIIRRMREVLQT